MVTVLVRGSGDVGSAVSHALFASGCAVLIHDIPRPAHARRTMAFADALFDGVARLDGVLAKHIGTIECLQFTLRCRGAISMTTEPLENVVAATRPNILIDARMRKRSIPEPQRNLAPLIIGLGPNFKAGENVDIAIETSWGSHLGSVIRSGGTKDLTGEPRELGNLRRERFVYAPASGTFHTGFAIGAVVEAGTPIGTIGEIAILAPATGRLRGLSHNDATVEIGAKIVEVDPRPDSEMLRGIGERPRRIAEGVLKAIRDSSVTSPATD